MNGWSASRRRRFIKSVFVWAALHYGILLCVGFVIFILSHLPTTVVNFDPAIIALVQIENVLVAPRKLLLWLWPFESTPRGLGFALAVTNSLTWGLGIATVRSWTRKVVG